jgi:hypothetical protein
MNTIKKLISSNEQRFFSISVSISISISVRIDGSGILSRRPVTMGAIAILSSGEVICARLLIQNCRIWSGECSLRVF